MSRPHRRMDPSSCPVTRRHGRGAKVRHANSGPGSSKTRAPREIVRVPLSHGAVERRREDPLAVLLGLADGEGDDRARVPLARGSAETLERRLARDAYAHEGPPRREHDDVRRLRRTAALVAGASDPRFTSSSDTFATPVTCSWMVTPPSNTSYTHRYPSLSDKYSSRCAASNAIRVKSAPFGFSNERATDPVRASYARNRASYARVSNKCSSGTYST